ncbi:AAA family ATPase [Heliorestis convoluta]|uniref:AAA family ATPase n=1 Tax=Heliorestis convoluta TaxID=356322 RepID=A0A5Q2N0X4_9FIRM|nr:AAA family ATPase [Heliorestis convoluta]QGG46942.1 AAA family ATPase [Heliorestis convoluta]
MIEIKKIRVEGLLGQKCHEFSLHDERITILHAPNGFGKTTLLKLIDHIFNGRLFELKRIPFRKAEVFFSDHSKLEIIREQRVRNVEDSQLERISYTYFDNRGDNKVFQPKLRLTKRYSINILEELLPFLERVGPELWEHTETGEILDYHDVIKLYGTFLPLAPEYEWPAWLKKLRKTIPVHFIGAQRLLQAISTKERQDKKSRGEKYQSTVRYFSNELVLTIQTKMAQSAAYNQELDRSFPERLLKAQNEKKQPYLATAEKIEKKLTELERKRTRLARVGLIDQVTEREAFPIEKLDNFTCGLLSLYIEDTEKKLQFFDDLEARLNLLLELVNKKFLNKELIIQRDRGFVIRLKNMKRNLEVEELSSGEQHILVMYYQLLFQTEPGEIVLMDEPELSLHIGWQGQFVEDLYEIIDLRKMTLLIATHSPDIINGRWNLTVELEQDDS